MTEWKTKTVGELADTQLGKMLNKNKQTGKHSHPYLRSLNVQWGKVALSDLNEMDILPEEYEKFTLRQGDLLICEGGESGRAAIWNSDIQMGFQNALHRVRAGSEISNKYLFYYFEWLVKNQLIEHLFNGVTIKHFPQENLRSVKVSYPPLPEQHKIVELLEDHLSRLDAALADVKQARFKAAQFRRSLLQAAFTRNLSGLGTRLMTEWKKCKLSDVVELLSGFAFKSSDWQEIGVPVLKITNVRNGKVTLEGCSYISKQRAEVSKNFQVNKGDLLITLTGEIGATGFYQEDFEARLNQRVGKIIPRRSEDVDLKFVAYFLESPQTRETMWSTAKGIAQANISPKEVLALNIPIPPLPEQQKIVEILEDHLSRLGVSVAIADAMEKQSSSLRRSLLQAAFTGQLTKEVASV